ncbi:DUF5518 domain-containing protein [Natronomonas sp.]|uniref:DUF5518 domain-containing protein n=1 Tax=Natronomonas sp. TaxID=2184060 RepID=UPI002613AC6D|nr:DUF5518 domain-containing protein [Natronomonas sp.]
MVPDTSPSGAIDRLEDGTSGTLLNALVGGAVGIVLSFVPLSTLLGGAVAGYLERGGSDGIEAGAIAGAIMLVPFAAAGLVVLLVVFSGGAPLGFTVIAVLVLLFGALYTVGLGALGGYLGAYAYENY